MIGDYPSGVILEAPILKRPETGCPAACALQHSTSTGRAGARPRASSLALTSRRFRCLPSRC